MAITVSEVTNQPASFSLGDGIKAQLMSFTANSGATSGTVTATNLKDVFHILLTGKLRHTAAPTFSGNVATLAFTVPAETAATLVVQDITYTAAANQGQDGNSITIQYTNTATAGAETVTVTGTAIVVGIQTTVSTATQVKAAIDASSAALALVSAAITGTAGTAQVTAAATPLAGGVTGGSRGTLLLLGR